MKVWLAPGVRAARVERDVVFLDIVSDAYLCLVDAAAGFQMDPAGAITASPPPITEELLAAGLLTRQAPTEIQTQAPRVTRGLQGAGRAITPRALADATMANARAAKAVAGAPFGEVLALAGPLDAGAFEPPSPALLAEAAGFGRMTPWLPRTGLCLMRSLQQRLYLNRRGHGVAWVFGVRTWPFEAHCWLQAGDVVLDDTLERVGGFTPIMVV